jgi:hypothetical protein
MILESILDSQSPVSSADVVLVKKNVHNEIRLVGFLLPYFVHEQDKVMLSDENGSQEEGDRVWARPAYAIDIKPIQALDILFALTKYANENNLFIHYKENEEMKNEMIENLGLSLKSLKE